MDELKISAFDFVPEGVELVSEQIPKPEEIVNIKPENHTIDYKVEDGELDEISE